jgi:hypothetical protein
LFHPAIPVHPQFECKWKASKTGYCLMKLGISSQYLLELILERLDIRNNRRSSEGAGKANPKLWKGRRGQASLN